MSTSIERTRNYYSQVGRAAVYRAIAIGTSFIAVPIMIGYLGHEGYGIWSTLLTIMAWMVYTDFGVGNGLRNEVGKALAAEDRTEAASLIGSGYVLIGAIAMILMVVVLVAAHHLPWQRIFNTTVISEQVLRDSVQVSGAFVVLNFWIGLIGALLNAAQRTSLIALGQLIAGVLALVFVFALNYATTSNLVYMSWAYGLSSTAGNVTLSFWYYRQNKDLAPRFRLNRQHLPPLLTKSAMFFVIQLAALILFATQKLLITQLFGPAYVAEYDVTYKMFSVISVAYGLVSAPLWSAYTNAFHLGDAAWIRGSLKRQARVFGGVVMAVAVLGVLAQPIVVAWIGRDFVISSSTVWAVGVFVLLTIWCDMFALVINGIGAIKIQMLLAVCAVIINVPIAVLLTRVFDWGVSGIVMASAISLTLAAVVLPIQVMHLVRGMEGRT